MVFVGNALPMRRTAGDCRLKSRKIGSVRLMGVIADPGVGGTEMGLATEWVVGNADEGARILRPPHFTHFAFSTADPGGSDVRLFRLPLRFGW